MYEEERNALREQYEAQVPLYKELGKNFEDYVCNKLEKSEVDKFRFESRVKETSSFLDKFFKPDKNYQDPFIDIMDILATRVIMPYIDDIDIADKLVCDSFNVIEEHSFDKLDLLNPDQFGYLSIHYIVTLPDSLIKEFGNIAYKNKRIEIQIRTELQNVWANVSHALNYKVKEDVPSSLVRRLNRMAGLFELADQELQAIKIQSDNLDSGLDLENNNRLSKIEINSNTISKFLSSDNFFLPIIDIIRSKNENLGQDDISTITSECTRLNIQNLSELLETINFESEISFNYLNEVITRTNIEIDRPLSILLLLIHSKPERYEGNFIKNRFNWKVSMIDTITELINP